MCRGFPTEQKPNVLVLAKVKAKEAEAKGYVGDSELAQKSKADGRVRRVIVATPDMMGEVGRLVALGPKG